MKKIPKNCEKRQKFSNPEAKKNREFFFDFGNFFLEICHMKNSLRISRLKIASHFSNIDSKSNVLYNTCNKILACFLVDSGAKMAIKAIHLQRQLPGNLDILVLTKHFQNPFPTFFQIVKILRRWYLRRTSIVHTSNPNNQQIGYRISEIQAFFRCLQQ